MDVLESTQNLVSEIADVVIAEMLSLEELVEVSLHQCLNDVHSLELLTAPRLQHVQNGNDLETE